jgi:acyl-CoA synthetase (AMP-forming)/AMP-acid ligase II
VMCGGGTLLGRDVVAMQQRAPRVRVLQAYGSTEATVISCRMVEDARDNDEPVGLGAPLQDVTAVLVGPSGETGAAQGELYVRSPRLMNGYWADPERTDEALVPDPLDGRAADRFYRTGDILKRREDGTLEYVTRTDLMVKSRGYRVDLREVENALGEHPATAEAAVVAIPHPRWENALVGFVELRPGARATVGQLRGHVASRIPAYMVPQRIFVVPDLPRTPGGKVDRGRLADDEVRGELIGGRTA